MILTATQHNMKASNSITLNHKMLNWRLCRFLPTADRAEVCRSDSECGLRVCDPSIHHHSNSIQFRGLGFIGVEGFVGL